jgi:hypothetical protein
MPLRQSYLGFLVLNLLIGRIEFANSLLVFKLSLCTLSARQVFPLPSQRQ